METQKKVYCIQDGETHHFVATSKEEAYRLYAEHNDFDPQGAYADEYATIEDVTECDPGDTITIHDESGFTSAEESTKTFSEWAAESECGMLCSSVW